MQAAQKKMIRELKAAGGIASAFPERLEPMLATKVQHAFTDNRFIYEVKIDGYRILAFKQKGSVQLRTRSHQDYSGKYNTVANALKSLPYSCVLDGEVIYLNEDGKPSFDLLQRIRTLGADRLVYCVFDVLWFEGLSLLKVPLLKRKELLETIIPKNLAHVMVNEIHEDGITLFDNMRKKGLEGIIAKEKESLYFPGTRSASWLKVQTKMRQEFVIGGWTESESGRPFRSLLFGYYDGEGKLIFYGHSGGGYTDKTAHSLIKTLKKIEIRKKPFQNKVDVDGVTHWTRPDLVAEFEYATTTMSGKIRKPAIFKGLRHDKNPQDVHLERSKVAKASSTVKNKDSNWPELLRTLKAGSVNILEIEGRKIELNNIEMQLWPGITKADVIKYYIDIAPFILPYLRERPLSLHIKHRGIFQSGMYIKGMEEHQPVWAETFLTKRKHKARGKSEQIDYLVCQDLATLIYIVNLGCIDINPWSSKITAPLNPDYFIIDLDPTGGPFKQVIKVAQTTKKVLDEFKIISFIKTSGQTGLHILLPVHPIFTYAEARKAVSRICRVIHDLIPEITTIENDIARRGKKVFIDDNQNDEADTIASPYSLRPYRKPCVSVPLDWRELTGSLDPESFTIRNVLERANNKPDPWKKLFLPKTLQANSVAIQKLLDSDIFHSAS